MRVVLGVRCISRGSSPVFVYLESHCPGTYLFCKYRLIRAVAFAEVADVHRIRFTCLKHPGNVPWPGCTCSCIGPVSRPCAAAYHCSYPAVQCTVYLLGTDKMYMAVNPAGCHDHPFRCKCFSR